MATDSTPASLETTMENEDSPHPDILFTSVEDILVSLANLDKNQDVFCVGDVSPETFRAIEAERDRQGKKFGLFYQPAYEAVIITVPTLGHSNMHTILYDMVRDSLRDMTAHIGWMSLSTTTFDATNGSSGQADSAGWPIDSRNAGDWPTLVVEAGFSQTLPSLRAKMRWWFSASDHQVKVVVLVKMDASHETICIEKWVERPNRPGATTTRQVTRAGLRAPEPFCDQSINITWTGPAPIMDMSKQDRTPARFRVSGAPLVIGFAEVYLRAPTVGEHDIAITDVDLQNYASLIWKYIV